MVNGNDSDCARFLCFGCSSSKWFYSFSERGMTDYEPNWVESIKLNKGGESGSVFGLDIIMEYLRVTSL